jgi:hypothetical protein
VLYSVLNRFLLLILMLLLGNFLCLFVLFLCGFCVFVLFKF